MGARASLLGSPSLGPAMQMALDEALLDAAPEAGGRLRFFRWAGAAVTFGLSQAYAAASAEAAARGMGRAPLVRRPTGGGVVLHDGDVTFSWVFRWPPQTSPQAIYKDIHRAVYLGLRSIGVTTRLWSPPRTAASGSEPSPALACFPSPVAIDVVTDDGRKVLGGALRRRRGWGLYQGSFRSEGLGQVPAALEGAIATGLFEGREPPRLEAGVALLHEAERLAAERYATDAWNKKR